MVKGVRSWFAVEEQRVAVRVIVEAVARDGRARGRRGEGFILDGWGCLKDLDDIVKKMGQEEFSVLT